MTVLHSMPRECRWNAFGMPIECRGNADECRHQNARNASGMPRDSRECRECRGTGGNAVGNAAGMPVPKCRECRGNAAFRHSCGIPGNTAAFPGMLQECRSIPGNAVGNAAGMPRECRVNRCIVPQFLPSEQQIIFQLQNKYKRIQRSLKGPFIIVS